ncbi:unnamed protein product [Urochloa humidicola]
MRVWRSLSQDDRRLDNDGTGMKPLGSCRCWPPTATTMAYRPGQGRPPIFEPPGDGGKIAAVEGRSCAAAATG